MPLCSFEHCFRLFRKFLQQAIFFRKSYRYFFTNSAKDFLGNFSRDWKCPRIYFQESLQGFIPIWLIHLSLFERLSRIHSKNPAKTPTGILALLRSVMLAGIPPEIHTALLPGIPVAQHRIFLQKFIQHCLQRYLLFFFRQQFHKTYLKSLFRFLQDFSKKILLILFWNISPGILLKCLNIFF